MLEKQRLQPKRPVPYALWGVNICDVPTRAFGKGKTCQTTLGCLGMETLCASHLPSSLSNFRPSVKNKGVYVWEPLCQPEHFGVNNALMAGFIIRLVIIQSNNPEVVALCRQTLLKLQLRYPGHLPNEAICGCDTRLFPSIHQTTIPQLKAWVATLRVVDFMVSPIP